MRERAAKRLARSREARLACPNRRACSQARTIMPYHIKGLCNNCQEGGLKPEGGHYIKLLPR